jgi:hypothetical protein
MPCGSYNNRRFGETYHIHHEGRRDEHASNVSSMLVTAKFVPSSLIVSTLMIEVMHSSETSVIVRST